MKFSVEKGALLKAIGHASRVVEKRNTVPILSNVMLRAEAGQLTLTSTDLDLEMFLSIEAEIEKPGCTTVPANLLHDIVRKLSGERVSFVLDDSDGNQMKVSSGRSNIKLFCLPETDFPILNAGTFDVNFTMASADLRRLISRTGFAVSTEETRYYLNGIFFHTKEEDSGRQVLRAVATDGHRLAMCQMDAPEDSGGMPAVIIPRKAVGEFDKLLDLGKEAQISVSSQKLRLEVGGCVMTTKLIDGTFPDYERVIPRGNNIIATAPKKELAMAADRVSTVSSEKSRAVKLSFQDGELSLIVTSPDFGNAEETMKIDYDADKLDIGFNNKYLQDILSNVPGDNVRLELADAGSPTLIREGDTKDIMYVLMPMRV